MKYLCLAYEEEKPFDDMPRSEWDALRKETLPTSRFSGRAVTWSSRTP
jgi:hypothetical protein